jgi:hypothetical protein
MAQQPWRDVYTVEAWNAATSQYTASGSLNSQHGANIIITQTWNQLRHYNSLKKDDLHLFINRAGCLEKLASDIARWLRSNPSVGASGLGRLLIKLADQAKLKAGYILKIHNFYTNDATKEYLDPQKLLEYLTKPIVPTPGLAQLMPGDRMEALDPQHRPFEMDWDAPSFLASTELLYCFGIWVGALHFDATHNGILPKRDFKKEDINYGDLNAKPPFFVWLEGDKMCLGSNKSSPRRFGCPDAELTSVLYSPYRTEEHRFKQGRPMPPIQPVEGIHWLVPSSDGQIREMPLGGKSQLRIFDTGHLPGKEKEPNAAAYVWTKDGTLLAGQHIPKEFHHSSFVAGDAVRCAGMISVINGKVKMISNNSGHYRPPKGNLKKFASWLAGRNVFAPDCLVITEDKDGPIPIAKFLKGVGNTPSNLEVVANLAYLTKLGLSMASVVQRYSVSTTKNGKYDFNSAWRIKSKESTNALQYLEKDFPKDIETAKLDMNDSSWYNFPKEVIRTLLSKPGAFSFPELLKQVSGRPVFIGNRKFSSLAGLTPLKKSSTMHSILSEEFDKL